MFMEWGSWDAPLKVVGGAEHFLARAARREREAADAGREARRATAWARLESLEAWEAVEARREAA